MPTQPLLLSEIATVESQKLNKMYLVIVDRFHLEHYSNRNYLKLSGFLFPARGYIILTMT